MNRRLYSVLIYSLIAIGIFTYLFFSKVGELPNLLEHPDVIFWCILASNLIGQSLLFISKWLDEKFPWGVSFGNRYFLGFAFYLSVGSIGILLLGMLYFVLPFHDQSLSKFLQTNADTVTKLGIIAFFMFFIYTLVDLIVFSYRQYAYAQIETINVQKEKLNLQFSALKRQLSPHFLFNSLNTLSSLLYRDQKLAETYLRKLAIVYMDVLSSIKKNLIPMEQELKMLEAYKYLMEIRYDSALTVKINFNENAINSCIPPLSLQLLLENAVKHNSISEDNPLLVRFESNGKDYISISNSCTPKPFYIQVENELIQNPERHSGGIGLSNIRRRYAYYSKLKVLIEKKEEFVVQLPILKMNEG